MGLDLYAGPLTRYYTGYWQTVVEQAAAQQGMTVSVVRPQVPDDAVTDVDEVRSAVLDWMAEQQRALQTTIPFAWPESASGIYWTDKPDWDGYWATYFLAAHDEFPDVPAPAQMPPPSRMPDLSLEPLYARVQDVYRRTEPRYGPAPRYPHLLLAEAWLPIDTDGMFEGEDVAGATIMFGTVGALRQELKTLNERTVKGTADDLRRWQHAGPPAQEDLVSVARFGLSVFLAAARFADTNQVPLKLDY